MLFLLVVTCCTSSGPPPIRAGAECVACSMPITDLRFACERGAGRAWRAYDSIECLVRDSTAAGRAWLSDYDARTLVAAESLWIARGNFPSPMGGGLAAFRGHAAAAEVAAQTGGRVGRFVDLGPTGDFVR